MNTLEFLSHLRRLDIELEPNGERLRITAPAKALTPALRNQLRERKADLLIFLRRTRGLDIPKPLPRNKENGLPLEAPQISLSQQTWQFVDSLGNQSKKANNMQAAWLLRGTLDMAQLEEAIRQMSRRHELLRTNFFQQNGQSYQEIKPIGAVEQTMRLLTVDLQHLSEEKALQQALWIASEEAQSLFPTEHRKPEPHAKQEALFRPLLLRIGKEKQLILLTFERSIADHWSMGLFMRELMQFYQGKEPPPQPLQYADFAHWQREALTDEILKNSLNYWQEQLANLSPVGKLNLPYDHARPALPSQEGRREAFHLSPELTRKLKLLSEESGATLIMTLLSAFNALLYRYNINEEQDIVLGIPVTLRNREETEVLIGNFLNILMLRCKVEGSDSFSDLLNQVRQNALDAYTHQEIPFYKVVEALQAQEKGQPTFPFFQVTFEWQENVTSQLSLPGLSVERFELEKITTMSDLSLKIEEQGSRLVGYFEYKTALFERATIQRITSHFMTLLKGVVANPRQSISKLPLLPFEEQYKVLVEWNQTETNYRHAERATIHQLFEEIAAETPYKPAISFHNQSLTYQELNQQANQLAHYLQRLGVGPDILVGICMERSLNMAIAMLAILKAGGAYLPLDPSHPQERLSFMIEDAQLSFLLIGEQLLGFIPGSNSIGRHEFLYSTSGKRYLAPLVICMEKDWPKITQQSKDNPMTRVTAHNLAYLIYNSSSTGKPKGILIEHQALVNHTTAMMGLYDLKATDRVLQVAPLSSDVATEEYFASWLSGATVILAPLSAQSTANSKQLSAFIEKEALTVLNLPTTDWHSLSAHLLVEEQALPTSLRLMVIRHEVGASRAYAAWLAVQGSNQVRCLNTYGPSETTISATVYEKTMQKSQRTIEGGEERHRLPIGQPIANTKLYILDKHLQPVPIGVPGELYIAGEGLARGYQRNLSLTNERFIANPFDSGRLYKTGDLARYLPDGNIEQLARLDHQDQIKMRGVHIELGEIEARLLEHPIVREGVVIARQSETKAPSLEFVAYFTPNQGSLPTKKQWQTFFSQTLPHLMVPAVVLPIENLPRLSNTQGAISGKIDYQSLAAPNSAATHNLIVPRTSIQHKLVEIWQEILPPNQPDHHIEPLSIHDNFFAVGGSHLLATRVLSRLQETWRVDLSIRNLFEAPTIAELAEQIETIQWATQTTPIDNRDLSMDNREEFDLP